jgi:hypothetical protein
MYQLGMAGHNSKMLNQMSHGDSMKQTAKYQV